MPVTIDYRDTSTPGNARAACIAGLVEGMRHAKPAVAIDDQGYVARPEENLIPGLSLNDFANDITRGAGQERIGKSRAVHSSAALAINCFAPLRASFHRFDIGDCRDLQVDGFERRFSIGLARSQAPHVDVVANGRGGMVAIQSTCLEYLTLKRATFSPRYRTQIVDERCKGPWFEEMVRLASGRGSGYVMIDAAQLIEHALGLTRASALPTTLLYLFWEPMDAGLSPLFARHRGEIDVFAARVEGSTLRFAAMSYAELWSEWDDSGDPFLRAHVAALRARYEVPAWAWEGVDWVNGRLQTADWLMDLINDPEAEREAAERAVTRAMTERGMSEDLARRLYGNVI